MVSLFMPKVSVIIPSYNHAQFLGQRICSVIDQTFQDIEIIFLDDYSTDYSQEVFSKYSSNPKITHAIFNESNSNSTFRQWNRGIELAAGEYVWIAESDDYAEPTFLERLVPILDRNSNVGIAYCQSVIVDEQSETISPNFLGCTDCFDRQRWMHDYMNDGKNECENFVAGKNTIPNASAVLFRKSVYKAEVGRDNELFKVTGDWFTWSKILLATDVYFVAESLNYFRSCEGSVSRKADKLLAIVRESLLIFDLFQERIIISPKARRVFFELVSNWWLTYYIISQSSLWNKEKDCYQQLLRLSPDQTATLSLQLHSLMLPLKRFRFNLKLGTILKQWQINTKNLAVNFASLIKYENY